MYNSKRLKLTVEKVPLQDARGKGCFTLIHCITLQHTAAHCNTLHHIYIYICLPARCEETLLHCITLQHTATHSSTQHHTAWLSNTLQQTTSHCITFLYVYLRDARCKRCFTLLLPPLIIFDQPHLFSFNTASFQTFHVQKLAVICALIGLSQCWNFHWFCIGLFVWRV